MYRNTLRKEILFSKRQMVVFKYCSRWSLSTKNTILKSVGGVTRLLENKTIALLRWELCSSHLARYLQDFEELSSSENVSICHVGKRDHHHEDTATFKESFIKDKKMSAILLLLILSRLIHFHESIIPQYHLMKKLKKVLQI